MSRNLGVALRKLVTNNCSDGWVHNRRYWSKFGLDIAKYPVMAVFFTDHRSDDLQRSYLFRLTFQSGSQTNASYRRIDRCDAVDNIVVRTQVKGLQLTKVCHGPPPVAAKCDG